MRYFVKLLSVSALTVAVFALAVPSTAAAFNIFNPTDSSGNSTGVDCSQGNNSQSAVCSQGNTTTNPLTGNGGYLDEITNIVAIVAGIAAVILIVVGGIRLTASGGDAEKVSSARKTVSNALIGIVVIVVAHTLIIYVVTRL